MKYELKRLAEGNLDAAIVMAKHYRDLNQPEEAESICRDVLDVVPTNEDALRILGLALTDLFPTRWISLFEEARTTFGKLPREYDRVYYTGVAWERYAKVQLELGRAHNAIHAFEEAMARFEEAERLGPTQHAEPILRWNRCVRALTTNPTLIEAAAMEHSQEHVLGD